MTHDQKKILKELKKGLITFELAIKMAYGVGFNDGRNDKKDETITFDEMNSIDNSEYGEKGINKANSVN